MCPEPLNFLFHRHADRIRGKAVSRNDIYRQVDFDLALSGPSEQVSEDGNDVASASVMLDAMKELLL